MPRKKKAPKKKAAPRKKAALKRKKRPLRKKARRAKKRATRARQQITTPVPIRSRRGLGPASGGQSGDVQGLSREDYLDSESVEELAEEGQSLESELVEGVEKALDPDQGEVTTSEVPEDDVPPEYRERD